MANGINGKADDESRASKKRRAAPPSQKLTGSSAAVRNFAGDKLSVGALDGSEGTNQSRKVRSSTTMSSNAIILPRSEQPGEQRHPVLGSSRSTASSCDGRTSSSVQSIGKAEVVAPSTSLVLSPSLLINMYLYGGCKGGVDHFAGVLDLLAFVQEHNAALKFPLKLMLMLTHIERESSKSGRSQKDEFGVSWTHDGQGFIIRNREDFVAKILPLFFSHTKFPSFIRKLYRWGFRKMCIPAKGQDGKMGDLIFAHEHFKRDNSNSIMANMKSVTAAGTRRAIANLMKNKTDNTRTCEKAAEVAPAAAGLKKPPPWSRDQHEKGGTSSTGSFIFGASAAPTAGTTSRSASGTIMTAIASDTPSRMVGILPKQRPPADMLVTGSSSSSSQQSIQGGHHVEEALRSTFSGGVDLYSRNDFEMQNELAARRRNDSGANHVDTTTSRSLLPRQHGGGWQEGFDIAALHYQQTPTNVSLLTQPFYNPFRPQSHIMLGSSASSWRAPPLGQTSISPMTFPVAGSMVRGSYPSAAQPSPYRSYLEDNVNNGTGGLLNALLGIQQMRHNQQQALLDIGNHNGLNSSQNPGDASSANGNQEEQSDDRRAYHSY